MQELRAQAQAKVLEIRVEEDEDSEAKTYHYDYVYSYRGQSWPGTDKTDSVSGLVVDGNTLYTSGIEDGSAVVKTFLRSGAACAGSGCCASGSRAAAAWSR